MGKPSIHFFHTFLSLLLPTTPTLTPEKERRIWWFVLFPLLLFTVCVSSGIEPRQEKVITVGMNCTWDCISFKQMAAMYCYKQTKLSCCIHVQMWWLGHSSGTWEETQFPSSWGGKEALFPTSWLLLQPEGCYVEDKHRHCYCYYLCLKRKDSFFYFLNKMNNKPTVLDRCFVSKEDFGVRIPSRMQCLYVDP